MIQKNDVKTVMKDHSLAKVELYSRYLEKYLAVLCNTAYVNSINIYDLFCGEGIYSDGHEGSPIVGIKKANSQLIGNSRFKPYIRFFFNDNEISKIEKGVKKSDRVKRFCNEIECHPNIYFKCYDQDFIKILPIALKHAEDSEKTKSLFFIDPYGYKEVKPNILKPILNNYDAELLLFLPATQMYRFGEASFNRPFPGSEHLYDFLLDLYGGKPRPTTSVDSFIDDIKQQFKKYLHPDEFYIDTFTIQRNQSNTYCLFFFTRHPLGYEKMLEAKWQLDEAHGKGFTLGKQMDMFSLATGIGFSQYPKILKNYLYENGPVTNRELYLFGLDNGYLSRHTKEALDFLKNKEKLPVSITSLDGKPARSYYLTHDNAFKEDGRRVEIGLDIS